ncbi:MAG: 50S ribosomal protein L21 [Desulfobacterales bacterium]|jgi:large subunit ribosomal protein L21|nr:50S ribosomal protein L21 [Desulfobacteraceae bacterium]MDD3992013.1 50S ribosomal protein L21 [Desulfobacteraceae bacterium]MDY0312535.1 50S ribosomal protein L21 [Desulfobacterales bacterium]
MYAIVETGGKQYKIQPGEVLRVEKLAGNVGDPVAFDKVLMLGTEDDVRIGNPLVDGARVTGRIVTQDKGRKIVIFKFKRRKGYRLKKGHRQLFTAVQIDAIEA